MNFQTSNAEMIRSFTNLPISDAMRGQAASFIDNLTNPDHIGPIADRPIVTHITRTASEAAVRTISRWQPHQPADPDRIAEQASVYVNAAQRICRFLADNPDFIDQTEEQARNAVPQYDQVVQLISWDFERYVHNFCDRSLEQMTPDADPRSDVLTLLAYAQREDTQRAKDIMYHRATQMPPTPEELQSITDLARNTAACRIIADAFQ